MAFPTRKIDSRWDNRRDNRPDTRVIHTRANPAFMYPAKRADISTGLFVGSGRIIDISSGSFVLGYACRNGARVQETIILRHPDFYESLLTRSR